MQQYGIELQYPDLPLVFFHGKDKEGLKREEAMPMELVCTTTYNSESG